MKDLRFEALKYWLQFELKAPFTLVPLLGDASFRRYFRVFCRHETFIAVDAPPAQEDSYRFAMMSHALRMADVNVPKVFLSDLQQGWMLLTDFGDCIYQKALHAQNADILYGIALKELLKMQISAIKTDEPLSQFGETVMMQELLNFRQWFLHQHLQIEMNHSLDQMLNSTFEKLVHSAITQPQSFIHRDYHSRNLMVLPDNIGVLDFQDAAYGPITYDAVSLLRDCYIDWPQENVKRWVLFYYESLCEQGLLSVNADVFFRWFDWMGIQRHLKAIFIFARKYHRDGVDSYLQYIPRALKYVMNVSQQYSELRDFYSWMESEILQRRGRYENT